MSINIERYSETIDIEDASNEQALNLNMIRIATVVDISWQKDLIGRSK